MRINYRLQYDGYHMCLEMSTRVLSNKADKQASERARGEERHMTTHV